MCTQKKNHEKRIKKKEIFVYSKYFLYLCAVIQFVRKYAYVIVLVLIN